MRDIKILFLSDTHGRHEDLTTFSNSLPEADIIVHCGDATNLGTYSEMEKFVSWFTALPFKHKVYVAGNHDLGLDKEHGNYDESVVNLIKNSDIIYLENSGKIIEGIKFWGSPATPRFGNWGFMYETDEIKDIWSKIPDNVEVLITHGPAYKVRDHMEDGENAGCPELSKRVIELKPKVHAFGHIHNAYGQYFDGTTASLNVATCNEAYEISNLPQIISIPKLT